MPQSVLWEKPQGKQDPIRLDKSYRILPRGIGLVIGCSTFPTWNGYPASSPAWRPATRSSSSPIPAPSCPSR